MTIETGPVRTKGPAPIPMPQNSAIQPVKVPGYGRYVMPWVRGRAAGLLRSGTPLARLNRQLSGYPRNHDFQIVDNTAVPSRRLYTRWSRIASLYPQSLTSLLDVGSCKGYFVLEAARRPTCHAAVGIDVHEPFVTTSRQVADVLGQGNAAFHVAALDQFVADPKKANAGPFQTVLLLNVYHYLFVGSELSPLAYHNHRTILEMLHRLCNDRVIFSSPLDLPECPQQVRDRAAALGVGGQYTRDAFVQAAGEFFTVEDHGLWGRRPLLVLRRRESAG